MKKLLYKISPKTIIIFSIVALILKLIEFIISRFHFASGGFIFSFGSLTDIIVWILRLMPFVLLTIYLLKLHKHLKATSIIPVISVTIVFSYIMVCIISPSTWYSMWQSLQYITFRNIISTISNIKYILTIFLFVMVFIGSWKKISKRPLIIAPIVSVIIIQLTSFRGLYLWFSTFLKYHSFNALYPVICGSIDTISTIAFYIALLMLCLKIYRSKKTDLQVSPEDELTRLKQDLSLSIISVDEYNEKRKEIISKL